LDEFLYFSLTTFLARRFILEDAMTKLGAAASAAVLVGGSTLALSLAPASAFTLSAPSMSQPVSSQQIDKIWWRGGACGWGRCGWRRGYGWRGYGWGLRLSAGWR
jgi:hypothetical protein